MVVEKTEWHEDSIDNSIGYDLVSAEIQNEANYLGQADVPGLVNVGCRAYHRRERRRPGCPVAKATTKEKVTG